MNYRLLFIHHGTFLKKNSVILVMLLCCNLLFSQHDYYSYQILVRKANRSDKDSAVVYLEKAIGKAMPFPEELKELSYQYFQIGNEKKAKDFFFKAIANGYQLESDVNFKDKPFAIDYDLGFLNLKSTSKYGIFVGNIYRDNLEKIRKLRVKYLKQIEPKDDATFEVLLQNENYFQELRFLFFDNKVKDSTAFSYIGKYGSTPNSYCMLELLKKGSFPKRRKCSRFNGQTITMLLNHGIAGFLDKEDAQEFVNLLWPLVEKGELTPEEYASVYDHYVHHFVDENKGLFGTMCYRNSDGDFILEDVLNPKEVNQIRNKYWVDSIEEFCKKRNWKLPNNYGR